MLSSQTWMLFMVMHQPCHVNANALSMIVAILPGVSGGDWLPLTRIEHREPASPSVPADVHRMAECGKIRTVVWRTDSCSEIGLGLGSGFHHQNSTPNPSRLGVSISASRKPRGDRARSACARGAHGLGRRAAGSTLFRPLFSQNLHQLFRRGTRTLSCAVGIYACVGFSSLTGGLDHQPNREAEFL